eukprot:COSAG01_NODE_196_length_22350_cov_812.929136_3_plen_69_part_00
MINNNNTEAFITTESTRSGQWPASQPQPRTIWLRRRQGAAGLGATLKPSHGYDDAPGSVVAGRPAPFY